MFAVAATLLGIVLGMIGALSMNRRNSPGRYLLLMGATLTIAAAVIGFLGNLI